MHIFKYIFLEEKMKKSCLIVGLLVAFSTVWGAEISLPQVERMVAKQALAQKNASPRVACELKQVDGYRLAVGDECLKNPQAKQEVLYLKRFLTEMAKGDGDVSYNTKALGPVNLSEQLLQQTFLVNHSWRAITERFMGFGPEDDPQFDYTKPGYFPEGTVKINMTERAYDVIRLYFEKIVPIYGAQSAEARGLKGFLGMVFFHEVMHGWQLHTKPVLDFKRVPLDEINAMLASRKPNLELVWGTNQIVKYEEDANVFTYNYTASVYYDFLEFVKAFEVLSSQKGFFEEYPRLADTFYEYYLVNQSNAAKELLTQLKRGQTLDTFNELNRYTYFGQSAPLQTWADMVEINDAIAAGTPCADVLSDVKTKYAYAMNLSVPEFNGRDASNAHDAIIMDTIASIEKGYSGLKEIRQAMFKEFNAFEQQCSVKL